MIYDRPIGFSAEEFFIDRLQSQYSALSEANHRMLPDFLCISPSRTGSTWLFSNLIQHPQIFVPSAKELDFFSSNWLNLGLRWYLKQFQGHEKAVKGDISPSYATLPQYRIQFLHKMIPNLKLIFIIRDPISRAWSDTKFYFKLRYEDPTCYTYDQMLRHMMSEGSLFTGDYQACLTRWLSVFPAHQILIAFFDEINKNPVPLIERIFRFLEVPCDIDWSTLPAHQIINAGSPSSLPDMFEPYLYSLYVPRTQELNSFLEERFEISLPNEWLESREVNNKFQLLYETAGIFNIYIYHGFFLAIPKHTELSNLTDGKIREAINNNNMFIGKAVDEVEHFANTISNYNEHRLNAYNNRGLYSDVLAAWVIEEDFYGYNIVLFRDKFFGLSHALGNIALPNLPKTKIERYIENGLIFIGSSLDEVRYRIAPEFIKESIIDKGRIRRDAAGWLNSERHKIEPLEELSEYNLVRIGDRVAAVAKSLGPVSILAERICERSIPPLILISDNLEEARTMAEAQTKASVVLRQREEELERLQTELRKQEERIISLTDDLSKRGEEIELLKAESDRKERDGLQTILVDCEQSYADLYMQLNERSRQIDSLASELSGSRDVLSSLHASLAEKTEENRMLKMETIDQGTRIKELESSLLSSQARLAVLRK